MWVLGSPPVPYLWCDVLLMCEVMRSCVPQESQLLYGRGFQIVHRCSITVSVMYIALPAPAEHLHKGGLEVHRLMSSC